MFRVKICGLTSAEDVAMVSAAGADAVGLNFYAKSPRSLSLEKAFELVKVVPDSVARVGLFVNATDDEVCHAYDHLGLILFNYTGMNPLNICWPWEADR